jgi:membrane protease YdiL (CAAX protease family)
MDADPRLDETPPLPHVALAPRFRALLEVAACSGYPSQVLIGLLIAGVGLGPHAGTGTLTLLGLSVLLALDSLLVIALVWWLLRAGGESPVAVLFGDRHWTVETVLGVSLMPVLFLLVVLVGLALVRLAPELRPPPNPFAALMTSPQDVFVLAMVGLLAGGVREEIQRAFILHRFEQHLGGAAAGLVCFSLLFGIGHALQGWPAVVTTTILGAFWGLIYLGRRSIVAPMVSHSAFNLIQTAFLRLQV